MRTLFVSAGLLAATLTIAHAQTYSYPVGDAGVSTERGAGVFASGEQPLATDRSTTEALAGRPPMHRQKIDHLSR